MREREQQQRSSSVLVDGEQGGEGEDKVDGSETEGRVQGLSRGRSSSDKDGRRVEGDDVDTAHLLTEHDNSGGDRGSSNSGDGEQLCGRRREEGQRQSQKSVKVKRECSPMARRK